MDKIKKAGFSQVRVLKEDPVRFLDYLGSDKVANNIINNLSKEDISQIDNAVVSIKVFAKKT